MMQRRPRRNDSDHMRFVAGRPCIICCSEPVQVAHIKMADARICKPLSSNIGMKADDRFTLPLCWRHHDQQHNMAEGKFWELYHLDPVLLSLALYSISGDEQEGDRLIRNASLASMAVRA